MKKKKRKSLRLVVAKNIREAAEDRDISLNHLADKAGVSRSQLFLVLAHDCGVSIEWLEKVADALDVDIVALVSR